MWLVCSPQFHISSFLHISVANLPHLTLSQHLLSLLEAPPILSCLPIGCSDFTHCTWDYPYTHSSLSIPLLGILFISTTPRLLPPFDSHLWASLPVSFPLGDGVPCCFLAVAPIALASSQLPSALWFRLPGTTVSLILILTALFYHVKHSSVNHFL